MVTGVQLPTAVDTARRGVRTPRIPMAGHGGPLFYTIYQSELLGQFRLIGDRASDVSGGRICLTQNAYAEI